ncbi:MAG TPA: metallopeptidase TldD-related protein [Candidatus Saccharimonadales bacterium]
MTPQKIISAVLDKSKADECMVIVADYNKTNLRWAHTGLTTNGSSQHTYAAVISIINQRFGSYVVSLDKLTNPAELAAKSELAARQSPIAKDYQPLLAKTPDSRPTDRLSAEPSLAGFTSKLGRTFERAGRDKLELFGYCEFQNTRYNLGLSTGLRRHHEHQHGQLELNAKSADFRRSVWAGSSFKDINRADPATLYKTLKLKAGWSRQQIKLKPGRYETILESSAVADLLLFAYWMSSARLAEEGHSAYSAKAGGSLIGQKLYSSDISIYSDPFKPGLETTPFNVVFSSGLEESVFDNGLELKRTDWVKNGVQRHLLAPRYLVKKYGYQRATPFIPNLIFEHAGANTDDMIKATKYGLLVTCLWYIREVDPQSLLLTGLTRDGTFLIENGQVKGAVNNFRFNMSPITMLKQVAEIGHSQPTLAREFGDYFPLTIMPALRVADFNMSSVSQAL